MTPSLDPASSTTRGDASRSDRAVVRDQRRSLEHAEHAGDLRRFRAGILVAVPTWFAYAVLDYFTSTVADGAPTPAWLWACRFAIAPIASVVAWLAFRRDPGPRLLRVLDVTLYGSSAFAIALMTVRYQGIDSHYVSGIIMCILARAAFSSEPWRRAMLPDLLMASAFPIVHAVAMCFLPRLRAQLSQPQALLTGLTYVAFLYGTVVLAAAGTNYTWTLRRQLFESRSIGRYRLQRRLAAGGMGEVWAAYHPGLKRDIALKILRNDAARDETAIVRFEREVKATSDLSHPNTIRLFDFGVTDDGIFYYAMELLEGETLAQLIRRVGPIDPARATHLVLQAARSLAEAHATGLIHRDVKPANIFLTTAGGEPDFVKVLDFGIAKRLTEEDGELTGTGLLAGTPKYMAPEIVNGGDATARSDVYGLGAVLYFLLTGRAPFEGKTVDAIYAAQRDTEVAPPSVVRGSELPPEVEQVVSRCLAKEPLERYADAGALADALAALGLVWTPRRASLLPPAIGADDPTKIEPLP